MVLHTSRLTFATPKCPDAMLIGVFFVQIVASDVFKMAQTFVFDHSVFVSLVNRLRPIQGVLIGLSPV